jgi:hypothetical protein
LSPREDQATGIIAAWKREQSGSATDFDRKLLATVREAIETDLDADRAYMLTLDTQILVDSAFLLLAIRSIVAFADRIIEQLRPINKEQAAREARDAFVPQYGIVRPLRDVVVHYDEYVIGRGRQRHFIVDPDEGAGVRQDEEGYLLFGWAGNNVRLLDAARAALVLSEELNRQFWRPAIETAADG